MNQVAKREPEIIPSGAMTPMDMIDRAVASGAGIETIEKLMGLQERWEANQARKAFNAAVADAKSEIKPVARNAKGHNSKRYADFAGIARAIDPILSKHDLSYRFRSEQGDRINVTCVLSHKLGHSEETTLSGPPDNTGNKNAVQAIGSTLTYLQRYSLMQALGLAAANDDDASTAVDYLRITQAQADTIREAIEAAGKSREQFLKLFKIETIEDLAADVFQTALDRVNGKGRA